MRLREIEARVVRLERDPANTWIGRMSDEDIDAEIIRLMNELAADHPTYDAMIEDVAATPEPGMRECAEQMRAFLAEYLSRQTQAAVR